jgi:hypothetical protein
LDGTGPCPQSGEPGFCSFGPTKFGWLGLWGWLVIVASVIGFSGVGREHLIGSTADAAVEHFAQLSFVVGEQDDDGWKSDD